MKVFPDPHATSFSVHAVQSSQKPVICISSRARVVLKFSPQMHVETFFM